MAPTPPTGTAGGPMLAVNVKAVGTPSLRTVFVTLTRAANNTPGICPFIFLPLMALMNSR